MKFIYQQTIPGRGGNRCNIHFRNSNFCIGFWLYLLIIFSLHKKLKMYFYMWVFVLLNLCYRDARIISENCISIQHRLVGLGVWFSLRVRLREVLGSNPRRAQQIVFFFFFYVSTEIVWHANWFNLIQWSMPKITFESIPKL